MAKKTKQTHFENVPEADLPARLRGWARALLELFPRKGEGTAEVVMIPIMAAKAWAQQCLEDADELEQRAMEAQEW